MALFKRAYAHGSMKALIDTGAVKVANEELAAQLADQASESLPEEPVGEVAPEETAELAANLVQLSNSLQESADNAAQAAEAAAGGAPAEGAAPVEDVAKSAALRSAATKKAASLFLQKLGQGTTITGDRPEQQNTPVQGVTGEGQMDQQQRPEGYANVGEDGVGTQQDAGKGKLGDEEKVEGTGMGPVAIEGSNTATEVVNKSASIRNIIKAAAQQKKASTTVGVGAPVTDASTGEGKLDDQNRPGGEGYANKGEDGVGHTDMQVPAGARIGEEKAHPGQESHAGGTNTVIQETKVGEDETYMRQFKQLGAKYANRFPFYFDTHQKVATIQYLMGLPPQEREVTVAHMEKTAEMPEGLKNYMAGKGNGEEKKEEGGEEKKDEDKKEEKKDEGEKKEASARSSNILARLRRLQA